MSRAAFAEPKERRATPSVQKSERPETQVEDSGQRQEEVARLAYQLWEEGGHRHDSADEDWFRAEDLLRQQQVQTTSNAETSGKKG